MDNIVSKHHYIQTKNCWIIKETGEKIPYGEISVLYYNFLNNLLKQHENALLQSHDKILDTEEYEGAKMYCDILDNFLGFHHAEIKEENFKIEKNYTFTPPEDQKRKHACRVNLVRQNGWKDFPCESDISLVDNYMLTFIDSLPPVSASLCFFDYEWCPCYELDDDGEHLILFDIMFVRNHNVNIRFCRNCGKLFIQRDKREKYCPDCQKEYKAIKDKEYSKTVRGLHKKILNYMRNMHKFTLDEISDFTIESDYYWNFLCGKEPQNKTYATISSESEYRAWLQSKHDELKKIAHTRQPLSGY